MSSVDVGELVIVETHPRDDSRQPVHVSPTISSRDAKRSVEFSQNRSTFFRRVYTDENTGRTKGNSSGPVPNRFFALARSCVSFVWQKRNTLGSGVYTHLDDGRRPTVTTTVIHDHVDLSNASTSAREYVFIGSYTTTVGCTPVCFSPGTYPLGPDVTLQLCSFLFSPFLPAPCSVPRFRTPIFSAK